jgi:hypothetical protein
VSYNQNHLGTSFMNKKLVRYLVISFSIFDRF